MASRPGTTSSGPPAARLARTTPAVDSGDAAEQRVFDLLRGALPAEYRIVRNWRWVSQRGLGGPARDGESDLVIVHPEQGILVLEVRRTCAATATATGSRANGSTRGGSRC